MLTDLVYLAWRRYRGGERDLIDAYASEASARRECERLATIMNAKDPEWRYVAPILLLSFGGDTPFEIELRAVRP